jgi:hypothetical protein
MDPEPTITINGVRLTEAQAMTVRVAVNNLAIDLTHDNPLGNDEIGKSIADGYQARIHEINQIISK